MSKRDVLLDVSRLIWRLWRGRLPTGVDRVCLAYLEHFRSRSRAVVQRRGRFFILDDRQSDRLFDLLAGGPEGFRVGFVRLALRAFPFARATPREKGPIYLNVGHTGLDEPSLGAWIARAGVRPIFLVHDLIPLLHPEFCRAGEQQKHRRRMINVLRNAAGIIGNSEATLRDLAAFAETQDLRMPPAIAALIGGPPAPTEVAPKHFDRPHFVTVGTIEGRKNHILLLNIWQRIAAEGTNDVPLLVIVGQRGWEAKTTIALLDGAGELRRHVIELGQCTDEELAGITAGARALLMPSFAEGFGLPVIEALEMGTPVIASDLAVFRESAADIPDYVDSGDGPGWEQAIRSFIEDSVERQRQLERLAGFRPPDWSTHFKKVDRWIETLSK